MEVWGWLGISSAIVYPHALGSLSSHGASFIGQSLFLIWEWALQGVHAVNNGHESASTTWRLWTISIGKGTPLPRAPLNTEHIDYIF